MPPRSVGLIFAGHFRTTPHGRVFATRHHLKEYRSWNRPKVQRTAQRRYSSTLFSALLCLDTTSVADITIETYKTKYSVCCKERTVGIRESLKSMLRRLEDRIRDLCAKAVVTIAQFLPQKLSRKSRFDRVDSLYSGCQQISGARYTNPISRKLARRFASSWELVFQSPLFFSQQARDFSSECQQLCRVLFLGG